MRTPTLIADAGAFTSEELYNLTRNGYRVIVKRPGSDVHLVRDIEEEWNDVVTAFYDTLKASNFWEGSPLLDTLTQLKAVVDKSKEDK